MLLQDPQHWCTSRFRILFATKGNCEPSAITPHGVRTFASVSLADAGRLSLADNLVEAVGLGLETGEWGLVSLVTSEPPGHFGLLICSCW